MGRKERMERPLNTKPRACLAELKTEILCEGINRYGIEELDQHHAGRGGRESSGWEKAGKRDFFPHQFSVMKLFVLLFVEGLTRRGI